MMTLWISHLSLYWFWWLGSCVIINFSCYYHFGSSKDDIKSACCAVAYFFLIKTKRYVKHHWVRHFFNKVTNLNWNLISCEEIIQGLTWKVVSYPWRTLIKYPWFWEDTNLKRFIPDQPPNPIAWMTTCSIFKVLICFSSSLCVPLFFVNLRKKFMKSFNNYFWLQPVKVSKDLKSWIISCLRNFWWLIKLFMALV